VVIVLVVVAAVVVEVLVVSQLLSPLKQDWHAASTVQLLKRTQVDPWELVE